MILTLEKQLVSLELARRLHQLGLPQGCLWSWVEDHRSGECSLLPTSSRCLRHFGKYAAPTVAETGTWLPPHSRSEKDPKHEWVCWSPLPYEADDGLDSHLVSDANEADARAKMLIYLIENRIVRPGEEFPENRELSSEWQQDWR